GLVFGARAGEAAAAENLEGNEKPTDARKPGARETDLGKGISTAVRKRVKRIMWERVGIVREREALLGALAEFEQISRANLSTSSNKFVTLAKLVATAALWREESRGGHFRSDFPETSDEWQFHSIQRRGAEISKSEKIDPQP